MVYVLLLVGFLLLIKGADYFVDGASSAAGLLKIPPVIIGLTVVAMGTSLPEASVSLTAGLSGNNSISLGNVIGSNLFNLLAVIGFSAMIRPICSPKDLICRDLWWNLGAAGLLFVFLWNRNLNRAEGGILLLCMTVYLVLLIRSAKKEKNDENPAVTYSPVKSGVLIVVGLFGVIYGGNLVVEQASRIAKILGMSDTLIGLTIVAIGTSLPELVTSITAARKNNPGIALGNAVGSCIFNILFILGMTSVLTPIDCNTELLTDTLILIGVCMLVFLCAKSGRKTSRLEGGIYVLGYVCYSVYIVARALAF